MAKKEKEIKVPDLGKIIKEQSVGDTKSEDAEFVGGMPVNLKQKVNKMPVHQMLKNDISVTLSQEIENQEELLGKLKTWQKMYRGLRKERNFPFPKAASSAIPLTRWLTETLTVRIMDTIFGQKKVWIVKALKKQFMGLDIQLEDALDWWQKHIAKFKKNIFSPLLQCIKMGTGIVKLDYVRSPRTIYRLATTVELNDPDVKKYRTKGGNKLVKDRVTSYNGVKLHPISREDWIQSSDSIDPEESFLCGFKKEYRPMQFKAKFHAGAFPEITEEEMNDIITGGRMDEVKKARVEDQYKKISESLVKKVYVYELWMRYDVDGDNEEDDIVVLWNHRTKKILKAIYNPYYYGFRPFQKFIGNPVEYSADGEGTCSILEKLQKELDTIHNQRLDRMTQINAPTYLYNPSYFRGDEKIYPGAMFPVDDVEKAARELPQHDIYPSTERTEQLVQHYAMQAVGVSPQVMGMPTSERPVAQETMALIEETNKKIKFLIDNIRDGIAEVAVKKLEMDAQFSPVYEYKTKDGEIFVNKTVQFPPAYLRDGIAVELMASSELMNTEVRRNINLTLYSMLSDFSTKMTGMAQALANPKVPMGMKQYIAESGKAAVKLMKRIVRDYGNINEDEIVVEWDDEFIRNAMQPQQPQQDPELQKMQMEAQISKAQAEMQLRQKMLELEKEKMDTYQKEQELKKEQMDSQQAEMDVEKEKIKLVGKQADIDKERIKNEGKEKKE